MPHDEPSFLARLGTDDPAALRPACPLDSTGEPRRVGVEIEFAGLDVESAARLVAAELGGTARRLTDYEWRVEGSALGALGVEVDVGLLKELGQLREDREAGVLERASELVLSLLAQPLAPCELVTDPLLPEELPALDGLVQALARRGATGTQEHLTAAFGVHFNPSAPSLDAASLRAHVQAYAALAPWIRQRMGVDLSRRLLPFIDPYPASYEELVLTPRYEVDDVGALAEDYLRHNPTRNRALDLLPLLMHLEPERVTARLGPDASKARPTYHFRLADSRLGLEGWELTGAWRHWLVVEDLAADDGRLRRVLAECAERPRDAKARVGLAPAWLA